MDKYLVAVTEAAQKIASQEDGFFNNSLSRDSLIKSSQCTLATLTKDTGKVRRNSGTLFITPEAGADPHMTGHLLARLFTGWRKDPPSTVSLILVAAEHFKIPADNKNLQAAIMVGIAADVQNNNPYHNNSHFREVTAMMARLCDINDKLASQKIKGAAKLGEDDIALCLATAAAHDLLHDGKGNAPDGPDSHEQYRLEKKAIEAIEPMMELAGMTQQDRERARVMIRITDVTAKDGEKSPHKIMRQIFAEIFDGVTPGNAAIAPPALKALQSDRKLLTMAALMSDSDLGPSAATNYLFNKQQSRLLHKENPGITVSDKSTLGFLNFILEKQFISPAAKTASGAAIRDILNKASTRNDKPRGVGTPLKKPPKKQF